MTFLARANVSARCSGFEAKLLHTNRPTRHGQGIGMTFVRFFLCDACVLITFGAEHNLRSAEDIFLPNGIFDRFDIADLNGIKYRHELLLGV